MVSCPCLLVQLKNMLFRMVITKNGSGQGVLLESTWTYLKYSTHHSVFVKLQFAELQLQLLSHNHLNQSKVCGKCLKTNNFHTLLTNLSDSETILELQFREPVSEKHYAEIVWTAYDINSKNKRLLHQKYMKYKFIKISV